MPNQKSFQEQGRQRISDFVRDLKACEDRLVGVRYEDLTADTDAPEWKDRIKEHIDFLQTVLSQLAPEPAAPPDWTAEQAQRFEGQVVAARSGDKYSALWILVQAEEFLEKSLPWPEALRTYLMKAFHDITNPPTPQEAYAPRDGTADGYIKALSQLFAPGDANKAFNLKGHKGKRPKIHENHLEMWIAAQVWREISERPEEYGIEVTGEHREHYVALRVGRVKGAMLDKAATVVADRVSTPHEPVGARRVKQLWRKHRHLYCLHPRFGK